MVMTGAFAHQIIANLEASQTSDQAILSESLDVQPPTPLLSDVISYGDRSSAMPRQPPSVHLSTARACAAISLIWESLWEFRRRAVSAYALQLNPPVFMPSSKSTPKWVVAN
jgi:hypothetical protein